MNRAELQRLAQERIEDAGTLIAGGRWSAAYYLSGYAVECALKSCIMAHLESTGMLFKDRKYLRKLSDCWTHDFDLLIDLAGLTEAFGKARGKNSDLAGFWGIVTAWTETSRYEQKTEADARRLYEAITQEPNGVLPWIRNHW